MVGFIPGSVVMYREPDTDLPPWPAVYCTCDVAPQWFLQTRPYGYYTLVLKLSRTVDTGQLRWATTTDLSHFDPFAASGQSTPGLTEAYEIADNALDSGLELKHWKAMLASAQDEDEDENATGLDSDEDMTRDPQMLRAIELSMKDVRSQEAQQFPTPSATRATPSSTYNAYPEQSLPLAGGLAPSLFGNQRCLPIRKPVEPPSRLLTPTPSSLSNSSLSNSSLSNSNASGSFSRSSKRLSPPSSSDSDDNLPSPPRRRKTSGVSGYSRRAEPFQFSSQSSRSAISPIITISDDDELPLRPRRRQSSTEIRLTAPRYRPQQPTVRSSKATSSALSARQVFVRNGLNASAAAVPNGDIVEGDLGECSQFVQVYVGSEVDPMNDPSIDPPRRGYKLQLLKHHIWERPYFRDTLSGRNYFEPIGENTWELVHPRLADISPKDFAMAAEFLSDGSFGTRDPDTEEQVAVMFAECISAWKTAELLNMDDLLEHIVDKVRSTRPWWELFNVMVFACFIYENEIPLQAHDDFKSLLSEFIAEHYDIYVEDDFLRAEFITRVKQLPELRRDIHKKIAEQTERRLERPQEKGVVAEEEHQHDDMDLYN